jgi:hypothetical protein
MTSTRPLIIAIATMLIAVFAGVAIAAEVNVNAGWPPPLILKKPPVVAVPETNVYRAPSLEFNVFVFGGKYYSLHNERWFMTTRVGAPWTPLIVEHVPAEVRAVPVKYYKIPPGHVKKIDYANKSCPPGLAKQGRC